MCSYFVLIETNILVMDKFVVKTPSTSSQEKKRSHLPVNISAKTGQEITPKECLMLTMVCLRCLILFICSSCNIVVDHL